MTIPTNTPTNVQVDKSGEVMSTTSDAIKITTKNPYNVSTINDRFSENNTEGYTVTPQTQNENESFPTIRKSVITRAI